jgi:hypothetical protein
MKFLLSFDASDAVCPPCEVEDHEGCQPEFQSHGQRWQCTCPCDPGEQGHSANAEEVSR